MMPLRIPLRVVFYREEGDWVAHCLEFDLMGHGGTKADALTKLSQAIRIQVEASLEHANPANLFSPADGRYFEMFAAGADVARGELELHVEPMDGVNIETVELREYSAGEPALA